MENKLHYVRDVTYREDQALEVHLALSAQHATERLERQKQAVHDTLHHLQAGVQRQNDLAKDVKEMLATEIGNAKAQIERVNAAAADAGAVSGHVWSRISATARPTSSERSVPSATLALPSCCRVPLPRE